MTLPVVRNFKSSIGGYHSEHGKIKAVRKAPTRPCVGNGMVQERVPGTDGL